MVAIILLYNTGAVGSNSPAYRVLSSLYNGGRPFRVSASHPAGGYTDRGRTSSLLSKHHHAIPVRCLESMASKTHVPMIFVQVRHNAKSSPNQVEIKTPSSLSSRRIRNRVELIGYIARPVTPLFRFVPSKKPHYDEKPPLATSCCTLRM